MNVEERFWSKVNKGGGPDACWLWTAGLLRDGYGSFTLNGKMITAHRMAWILTNGPIPAGSGYHGTVVRHRCDVPACCNPTHLELGSMVDNNRDRDERGRGRHVSLPGEQNGQAKLTESQVLAIRDDPRVQWQIAADFGVNQSQISYIKNRKKWAHVATNNAQWVKP